MNIPDPLGSGSPLIVYMDFKSPYAYMALAPTYQLEDEFGIEIDWRPLTLDIPSFLGSARVDNKGKVLENKRSQNQWGLVKYAYRDVKRTARQRGLILKGTVKIWDSSLAGIGILWAKARGREVLKRYFFAIYERFWRRELDIENPEVVVTMLENAGAPRTGCHDFLCGEGRALHDGLQERLLPAGLFGVPTYVVGPHRFFGREHLPVVRWCLQGGNGAAPDIAYESWPAAGSGASAPP